MLRYLLDSPNFYSVLIVVIWFLGGITAGRLILVGIKEHQRYKILWGIVIGCFLLAFFLIAAEKGPEWIRAFNNQEPKCFDLVNEVKNFREYKKRKIEEMFLKYGDTSRIIEELRVPVPPTGLETNTCEEIKAELAKAKEYVCKSLRDYGEKCD